MFEDLLENITIYHKEGANWSKYTEKASVRATNYLNRNKTGSNSTDNALIRVFNTETYNMSWKCSKGDIIYLGETNYEIVKAPITELSNLYGKEKVFEVTSVEKLIFPKNEDLKELNHIKIGAK